jgi:hypothetical protein
MTAVDLGIKGNIYLSLDSDFETEYSVSIPLHGLSSALLKLTACAVHIEICK